MMVVRNPSGGASNGNCVQSVHETRWLCRESSLAVTARELCCCEPENSALSLGRLHSSDVS
eukprot:5197054-Amphidinium_carterae.1